MKTALAFLMSLSASATVSIQHNTDLERCTDAFARDIHKQSKLSSFKVDQLALAICSNPEVFNMFLSVKKEEAAFTSEPLLLVLRDSRKEDLAFTLKALRLSLFPGQFTVDTLRAININVAQEVSALEPSDRNVLTVDLDAWIDENRLQKNPGMLLRWLDQIKARHDVLITAIAVAKFDPEHYKAAGHPEIAQFLETFHPVYYAARAPKTGNCQKLL